ncbi:C6 zinc finger protein [Colletotrichum somersetense]|nr:C6 zinc finger protein [Colletotrichum somersetense]
MASHPGTGCSVSKFHIIERPKVSRRHGPKTRTGCITCKKRHVRCDEGKPTCQNCARSKRECEGYVQKQTSVMESFLRGHRPILIKPNYETLMFTNQLEKDHFDYWLAFSKEFTLFPSELMTHTLPQIAREDPAIRHAAFAIGAATLGSDSRSQRTSGKGLFVKEAFQYHGRAISFILSSAEDKKSMPRALLSCLLFITFEAIQGNNMAARTHINHGCIMLGQLMRQGINKDCPPELIDEVMSSFRRLTLQSWNVKEYHPPETDTWVPWCCRGTRCRYAVDELPDLFRDISDARRWWEVVQHHIVTQTNMYLSLRFNGLPAPSATNYLSKEQMRRCGGILDRWRHGLDSLDVGAAPRQYEETQEHSQVLSLKLLHLSFEIYVKTCQYTNNEVLTTMTSSFRQVVSMSRTVLEAQSFVDRSKEVFTMDSGLSWSLLTVSTYCADVKLRKEAQMLLREYPRRDGIWDTRLFAALSDMGQNTQTSLSGDCNGPFGAVLLNKDLVMYEDEGWKRAYALVGGKWQIVDEERMPTGLK